MLSGLNFGVESIPHLHSNDIHVYTWLLENLVSCFCCLLWLLPNWNWITDSQGISLFHSWWFKSLDMAFIEEKPAYAKEIFCTLAWLLTFSSFFSFFFFVERSLPIYLWMKRKNKPICRTPKESITFQLKNQATPGYETIAWDLCGKSFNEKGQTMGQIQRSLL